MSASKRTIGLTAAAIVVMLSLSTIRILGLGAIIGNWRVGGAMEYARDTRVRADLQAIRAQLTQYKAANGTYPSTEQGLAALVVKPTLSPMPSHWRKLLSWLAKDPWQNDYVYRCPGRIHPNGYDLFSPGPDHKADTLDDDWGE
jgi:general secretion pathway protein G